MVSLLAIFWILATVQAQTNNVCIWDRRGAGYLNNMLNGQYIYDGSHNSHSSWKKTQHANCGSTLYLYWHQNSFWAVGVSKGADSYYARCTQSNIASCTAGQWEVNGSSTSDATMRVISGNCPYWPCASITTNAPGSSCDSFTTQIGTNAWAASNNYVLYYSTMYMSWLCINAVQYDYTDCNASYVLKTATTSWQDVSSGSSTSLSIEFSSPTQATLIVSCNGAGQTLPTPQPTVPTPQPIVPTLQPVVLPTPQPVTAPVFTATGTTNSICIWDRRGDGYLNNMLNGEYIYDGSHNSHSSWKKTQHANCGSTLYLYWHQYDHWAVGVSKGADSYHASCIQSNIASCTAGQWKVGSGSTSDAIMRVISGNCPYWSCATITTNAPGSSCDSFTTQIGTNVWKGSNNYVWYYSTMYMSWMCINSAQYDYTDCSASYQLKTSTTSWQDVSLGSSTSLSIDWSYPSQATVIVSCNGAGQTLPTPQPTVFNPALNPVTNPATNQPGTAPVFTATSTTKNICIWDRRGTGYLNNMLNGQYIYDGSHNSHSSWIKTQHANCGSTLYLYWHQNSFWAVGASKGADSYYARCAQSAIALCTTAQWKVVVSGSEQTDATMRAISGNCPYWSCASITTNSPDSTCKSFTSQINTNTWYASNNYVWYYSTMYMSWLCINAVQYDYTDCSAPYQLKTATTSWQDVSSGSSTSLSIEFSFPSQATLIVSCNGSSKKEKVHVGNWWIYVVIVLILVVFFLCVCCIICLFLAKKRKRYKKANRDEWGDTVQMNRPSPQRNIDSIQWSMHKGGFNRW